MATNGEVLGMLLPQGGWILAGDNYEDITFLECEPITKKEFKEGFAKYDAWVIKQAEAKAAARQAILDRLGITADEAALLLG